MGFGIITLNLWRLSKPNQNEVLLHLKMFYTEDDTEWLTVFWDNFVVPSGMCQVWGYGLTFWAQSHLEKWKDGKCISTCTKIEYQEIDKYIN
jgi:hypothetical protein